MEEKYKIAVVIPTLNEELYIRDCLNSVISQSFPFSEMDVMVIDGGSRDRTRETVAGFCERYPNIRLIENPKKIQSAAFNTGVANSSAPYIVRLDAHSTYNREYIELCVRHLVENEKIGNAGGICNVISRNSGLVPEANAILNKVRFGIGGASFRIGAKAGFTDTVPFGSFPRKVIEEIGGMREDLPRGEDNEFNNRIRKAGYKIYLDPEIVCTYYSRDTFRGSVGQMYANGVSIGRLLHIDPSSVSLRHLVPLAFVLSLALSLVAGIFWRPAFLVFAVIFGLYITASITATISACCRYGKRFFFILPLLFLCVHCAYGWGTISGILKR